MLFLIFNEIKKYSQEYGQCRSQWDCTCTACSVVLSNRFLESDVFSLFESKFPSRLLEVFTDPSADSEHWRGNCDKWHLSKRKQEHTAKHPKPEYHHSLNFGIQEKFKMNPTMRTSVALSNAQMQRSFSLCGSSNFFLKIVDDLQKGVVCRILSPKKLEGKTTYSIHSLSAWARFFFFFHSSSSSLSAGLSGGASSSSISSSSSSPSVDEPQSQRAIPW